MRLSGTTQIVRTSAATVSPSKRWLLLCVILLAGWLLGGCGAVETPPQGEKMQVIWGETVYRLECARCHDPGRVARVLTEERLSQYRDAAALFDYTRKNMPLDKPGALPEQDYWDVTAYLLANAGMLPGRIGLGPATAEQVDFLPQ
jgi:mono/diheme cytochrome c family protein